jgi:acyl-[acyl-carrier-protein] desaturase
MSYQLPERTLAQIELLCGLNPVVDENLGLLASIEDAWQPTDYLPDLTAPDWDEQLRRFRGPSMQLSDEVLVVLVGDMVTEEALPNYAISLNLIARDIQGDSPEPWSRWMRGWVAEENRHGDLLNAFLRLTGRVDMRSVEVTVNHLIANGFNPRAAPDLYAGLVYTAFQERATMLSHLNVGKLARKAGDTSLARICARIAGDESRHAVFYARMMHAVIDQDPAGAILVFRDMMRRVISMPGKLMYDGKDPDLFEHFAIVAQRLGVYTVHHYAEIIAHLVSAWDIAGRSVSGKAAKAQEFLCVQAERLEGLADSVAEEFAKRPATAFSWIHGRKA